MSCELFQILKGHQSDVNWIDFSGHRKLVSCSNDRTVRLWRTFDDSEVLFDPTKLSVLVEHDYGVNCVRYSPFGTIIASASTDGYIILWNSQVDISFLVNPI
ncbi:Diacylglycerol kinase beta [Sarcoptes scabiei]|nr:Diacylglycerol kinase beta [Sarcoptes scabiei]